jgi:hypothetical protein
MPAIPAGYIEPPHAELAHVAERHRLDLVSDAAGGLGARLAQVAADRSSGEVLEPRPAQGPGWAPCDPTDSVSLGTGESQTSADRFGGRPRRRSRLRARNPRSSNFAGRCRTPISSFVVPTRRA